MDLTEAEDIKKRGQEYTEELNKTDLRDPDNHNGLHLHSSFSRLLSLFRVCVSI